MDEETARLLINKLERSMTELDEIVSISRQQLTDSERVPFSIAIGKIFAIYSDEIKTHIAQLRPELRDELFPPDADC